MVKVTYDEFVQISRECARLAMERDHYVEQINHLQVRIKELQQVLTESVPVYAEANIPTP